MLLTRTTRNQTFKGNSSYSTPKKNTKPKEPNVEEMILARDFSGAVAVLEFYHKEGKKHPKFEVLPWLGYCAFHLGDFQKAANAYQEMIKKNIGGQDVHLHLACCQLYLGLYKEAEENATKVKVSDSLKRLQRRLLFHIADRLHDEGKVMQIHKSLEQEVEDQLCLASMHLMRGHVKEALDLCKRLLLEETSFLALNVYIALCYYKSDYFDVSLEVLNSYLTKYPDSPTAVNLKACSVYKKFSSKAAEEELQPILDLQYSTYTLENYLIKHNLVVFRDGENALQILPSLVDIIPEAKLNLVIYYLRNDEVQEAYNLIKDVEAVKPQEYILKAIVHALVGQTSAAKDHLQKAQSLFQVVGSSQLECDTIPGRQCMASYYFLRRQYDDTLVYLKSIKTFFPNHDEFNWNFGLAQAGAGLYKEAEQTLLQVQNEKYKQEYCYISWLARCYIMNSTPNYAWELYLKMETSSDSIALLQLIANDCYKIGSFYYAAKAFDVLERLDPNPEYWEGKKGACIGVLQQVCAGKEQPELLKEVVIMLKNNANIPQGNYIIQVIRKYAKEHFMGEVL